LEGTRVFLDENDWN